jgi:uncharacterized membrane protein
MRCLASAAATIAGVLVLSSPARADISVCNDFVAPIHVAFAYQVQGKFTAEGWWSVAPNKCTATDFSFQGSTLYYAADSDSYKSGRGTSHDHWGNKTKLFVTRKKFTSDNASQHRRGTRSEMFSQIELTPQQHAKPVTITLHFTQGSTTINVKMK